jgi:hypothetical protein
MIIESSLQTRRVNGLAAVDLQQIDAFLLGILNARLQANPNDWFSLRDMLGGQNRIWDDTPMQRLYEKQLNNNVPEPAAVKRAGQEAGRLFARVIVADSRRFRTKKDKMIRHYQWVP